MTEERLQDKSRGALTGGRNGVYTQKLDTIAELLSETPSRFAVADALGTELTAHESVPAAVFAFPLNRDSFRDAVT